MDRRFILALKLVRPSDISITSLIAPHFRATVDPVL